MATYPSPVSVPDFQKYINDLSADPAVLAFFQSLLDTATERIYTYLDTDFTASAVKTDIFWGDGSNYHRLHLHADAVTMWKTVDEQGTIVTMDITKMHLFEKGLMIVLSEGTFECEKEHQIAYTLPSALVCPETVRQVITEVAAVMLRESKQGGGTLGEQLDQFHDANGTTREVYFELTDRHRDALSPYKRYAV